MVMSEESGTTAEIVVAVEATANMVSHWEVIKKQYIIPAVQHFHKQSTNVGDFVSNMNSNRYGLVLFHAADRSPDSTTECLPPTRNAQSFIKMLDAIQFSGGGGEHYSYITEGLATALQLFEDLKETETNGNVEKFCFLVSNTPPYQQPSVESLHYAGLTWKQLAEKMKDIDVKMSIICPRHIGELRQIFLLNNNQPQLMNYAQDRRHLVLVSGFRLPTERDPIPVTDTPMEEDPPSTSSILTPAPPTPMEVAPTPTEATTTTVATAMSVDAPSPAFQQAVAPSQAASNVATSNVQQPLQIQNSVVSNISNPPPMQNIFTTATSVPQSAPPASQSDNASIAMPQNLQQQQQQQQINMQPNQLQINRPIVTATASQNPQLMQAPASTSLQQTPIFSSSEQQPTMSSNMMKSVPQQPFAAAQEEAKKVLEIASVQISQQPQQHPPPQPSAVQDSGMKMIWSGQLEWSEKKRPPPNSQLQKITHIIGCHVYQPSNNLPDVNTMHWTPKLSMQIIPQQLIFQVQSHLKSARQLLFRFMPQNLPQLISAFTQTPRPVYGLIQFNIPPDSKGLILVCFKQKNDKNTFIGLVPIDANALLNALREVVQNRPNRPIMSTQDATQQGAGGMQGMVQQPGINTNAGMQMNQFRTQQQQQQRAQFPQQARQTFGNQPMGQMQANQPRMNQPGMNQGMSNIQRVVNVPTMPQQQNRMLHATPGNQMIRTQIRNVATAGSSMQMVRNTPGTASMATGGPGVMSRVMPGQGVMAGNRPGLMRVQHQIRTMGMQGNRAEEQPQLRHLLGSGNATMQQGGMPINQGQNAPGNMQQTYIRPNNMMQGIQNQRRF